MYEKKLGKLSLFSEIFGYRRGIADIYPAVAVIVGAVGQDIRLTARQTARYVGTVADCHLTVEVSISRYGSVFVGMAVEP